MATHTECTGSTFGDPPTREGQNWFRLDVQTSSLSDKVAQPIRFCAHLIDSATVLTPWPNQPLPVIRDYVFFETGAPLFLSASLYFDSSDAGFTNHNVINVEILLTSFTRHVVEDAIPLAL